LGHAWLVGLDEQHVWTSDDDYIPNRRAHCNRERSAKVIYDTVRKVAKPAGVKSHVHALRAAFAVRMDEQYPGHLVAVKELLGHSRLETAMVNLRRQDKERDGETVRGLSWGSVFPPNAVMPPARFEPALPENDGTEQERR
jgi:integrase